jgi:hypothetical protein
MKEGFWGLSSPTGTGRAKALVLGAPGAFFGRILEASRYVELYDEKLGCEPWRRGVATAVAPAGRAGGQRRKLGAPFACLVGYRRLPRGMGTPPAVFLAPGAGARQEASPEATLLVIDPFVMNVTVMNLKGNPTGGLEWYPFLNRVADCFSGRRITTVLILPRALPRKDEYPAFVLARLVSRILALALQCGEGRGR